MSKVYRTYISNCICKKAEKDGDMGGWTELILYNPTTSPCLTTMTVYFTDREPHTFAPIDVAPESNELLVMPRMDPAVFENCGFWGAKFESSTYMLADPIGGMSFRHPDRTFGGCAPTFWSTDLHREWYFADGLWLEWKRHLKGDISKAPFPFNELEYYYFLNPGQHDAQVDMTLLFRNIEHVTFHLHVPAERVYVWSNFEKIPYNQNYGVRVVSSEPTTTSSVRYIYGLNGFEEWGLKAHLPMPAEPGPYSAW